jgi:hypothetical protein
MNDWGAEYCGGDEHPMRKVSIARDSDALQNPPFAIPENIGNF